MKRVILLYILGIASIIGIFGVFVSVGYETSGLREEIFAIKKDLGEAKRETQAVKDEELKFKTDLYNGMATLMQGQHNLASAQLRIHHFAEPHSDKFYPNCYECQKERQEILDEDKDSITRQ